MSECRYYLVVLMCFEGVQCHMPANGESVTITTVPTVPVDVSLSLLKRTLSAGGDESGLSQFHVVSRLIGQSVTRCQI